MKKNFLFLPLLIIGLIVTVNMGCTELTEDCSSEEVCTGKDPVSTCCTEGVCVYKYNGNEYPDTEQGLNDLLDAMNCTTAKSGSVGCDIEEIKMKLEVLLENTRASSLRKK